MLTASKMSTRALGARRMAATRVARPAVGRKSTVSVKAHCGEFPLVGSVAPNFKAQAVFDQVGLLVAAP